MPRVSNAVGGGRLMRAIVLALTALLAACTWVGPETIRSGRPDPPTRAPSRWKRALFDLVRLAAASIELLEGATGAVRYPERGPAGR